MNPDSTVVLMEQTGKQIVFSNTSANAVPPELRRVGVRGFISFPKAPPVFTAESGEKQADIAA